MTLNFMTLLRQRSALAGMVVALVYIVLTWALYQSWMESLADGATGWPVLLRILSYPIPGPATVENGGAMPFWSVLVQGVWLGAIVGSGFGPTYGTGKTVLSVLLSLAPFIVLYLVSGSLVTSLLFGLTLGLVITGGIQYLIASVALRRMRREPGADQ